MIELTPRRPLTALDEARDMLRLMFKRPQVDDLLDRLVAECSRGEQRLVELIRGAEGDLQQGDVVTARRTLLVALGEPQLGTQSPEVEQLRAAVDRTTAKMREYNAAARERGEMSARVNAHQVINLLSPTWPDGNYAEADRA